jgi:hypothetical protein
VWFVQSNQRVQPAFAERVVFKDTRLTIKSIQCYREHEWNQSWARWKLQCITKSWFFISTQISAPRSYADELAAKENCYD